MHADDLNDSMPGLPPVVEGQRFKPGDRVRLTEAGRGSPVTARLAYASDFKVEAVQFPGTKHEALWLEGFSDVIPFGAWRFEHSAAATQPPEDAFEVPAYVPLTPTDQAVVENLLAHEAAVGPIPDNVTLPKHYARFKIEPIRFVAENGLDFFRANIIKYIMRHDAKNGMEDLKKAQRYLEMFIKFKQDDPDWWKAPS